MMLRLLLIAALVPIPAAAQGIPDLTLREELRLGQGLNQGLTFTRVVSIVPRADGAFYVADAAEKSVRLFARDGRLLKVIGREGAGPGEFRALESAGRWGDTLWVVDPQLRRVSLFSADGEFLKSLNTATIGGAQHTLQAIQGVAFIVQTRTYTGAGGTNHGADNAVVKFAYGAGTVDTIVTLKFGAGDWLYRATGATPFSVIYPNPFNDGSLFDANSKGGNLTVVNRIVASGRTPTFEVVRLDATGKPEWSRRLPYTPQAIPATVKDSVTRTRAVAAIATFPEHMPAVSRVVAGEDGSVWLRREELRPNRRSEWNVLDASGRMIGRFETRRPLQIHAATAQYILVSVPDDDDVPLVIRYAIVPAR
ncbi:MAG: 6-bladed beta-propeller [Longimicrobiales bacterium]